MFSIHLCDGGWGFNLTLIACEMHVSCLILPNIAGVLSVLPLETETALIENYEEHFKSDSAIQSGIKIWVWFRCLLIVTPDQ